MALGDPSKAELSSTLHYVTKSLTGRNTKSVIDQKRPTRPAKGTSGVRQRQKIRFLAVGIACPLDTRRNHGENGSEPCEIGRRVGPRQKDFLNFVSP